MSRFSERDNGLFLDLLDVLQDESRWQDLRNLALGLMDNRVAPAMRRRRLVEGLASIRTHRESMTRQFEACFVDLLVDGECPVVQDMLARAQLRRAGVVIRPLAQTNAPSSSWVGVLDDDALKAFSWSSAERSPIENWLLGVEFADRRLRSGAGAESEGAGIDAEQALAGLSCLSMVVLNLHHLPAAHRQRHLTYLLQFGVGLWLQLKSAFRRADHKPCLEEELEARFGGELYQLLLQRLVSVVELGKHQEDSATADRLFVASVPANLADLDDEPMADQLPNGPAAVVVSEPIAPASYREDREQLKLYEALREPMPVRTIADRADLDARLGVLSREFPWAVSALEVIRDTLEPRLIFGQREIKLPNLLLVGPPGSGKSRLARRLAEVLDLPFMPLPVGGSADVKLIIGTSRGWGSGSPSPLLVSMLSSGSASGLVLLDELDKAGRSDHDGRVVHAVLSLLEPETARRYRDGYLQAACDLSWLSFVATANTLMLPQALLSRFRIVHVPEPCQEHRPALAASMVAEIASAWQMPPELFPPIPAELLSRAGRSARDLQRAIEDYLADWTREAMRREAMH